MEEPLSKLSDVPSPIDCKESNAATDDDHTTIVYDTNEALSAGGGDIFFRRGKSLTNELTQVGV